MAQDSGGVGQVEISIVLLTTNTLSSPGAMDQILNEAVLHHDIFMQLLLA